MLTGKSQASTMPTAMGSMLQASTYGATIPIIYGRVQSPMLAIWAANLRQGGPRGKKFKQMKKGIIDYCENIDFLLGHNPILGVLQMWSNGGLYPLNFLKYSQSGLLGGGGITPKLGGVADRYAYAPIGVTATIPYTATFNDYGSTGGPVTLTGTYEVPLWNELFAGPDPTHGSAARNFPYCYRWDGSSAYNGGGFTVYIDYPDFSTTTINIYYAQLASATSFYSPLAKNYLAFEPDLGSGPEYADAGNDEHGEPYTNQQVIFPMFAGVGSSEIDLGAAGVIPQLQAEVQGKWSLYPTGDADFADMIEDVFRGGIAQAALGALTPGTPSFTQLEHGLSGYTLPGAIQYKTNSSVEAFTYGYLDYNLPVQLGNFLVVLAWTAGAGGSAPSISDSLGNTWTPIVASGTAAAWVAKANATGACQVRIAGLGYGWHTTYLEIAGVDTLDAIALGDAATASASITTTNQDGYPCYLLAICLGGFMPANPRVPQWTLLTPTTIYGPTQAAGIIQERTVRSPGTFTIQEPLGAPASAPAAIAILALKATQPASYPLPVGDFVDNDSLDQVRLQCRANGLWGALSMNSQQTASNWLETLYAAANAAPVFMGFKLYSLPYSEVSAVGNGAIYNAPTAPGPVAALSTENGSILAGSGAPVEVKLAARVNQPNVLQMQCLDRNSNYNPSVVAEPDAASISLFGVRKADPVVNNAVMDVGVARMLLGIQVRKLAYGADVYSFSVSARWTLLAPMDLVTITDPLADISALPVRITSIAEQSDGSLQCQAEPFVYGMYAPTPVTTDTPTPYAPNTSGSVAAVNPPIIFEPTPPLIAVQNQGEVWVVVSDSDPNYGGAVVYISTDGGVSYNPAGDPLVGSAITGVSTADWPAAASPDTSNDLPLNLAESLGVLASYAVTDEDNFLYPCYIAGGGSYAIPYELMTYATATLTGANAYTLKATGTGNHLNRGVFGAPAAGVGVDHPSGSRWAFLPPNGQGVLRLPLQPAWIGATIWFKAVPFNKFGVATGDLSTATAYSYTVLGTSGSGPQLFQVNGA